MKKSIEVKEFSLKKELIKLTVFICFALVLGLSAIFYTYMKNYFMASFLSLGVLGWCWNIFMCIREIVIGIKWMNSI